MGQPPEIRTETLVGIAIGPRGDLGDRRRSGQILGLGYSRGLWGWRERFDQDGVAASYQQPDQGIDHRAGPLLLDLGNGRGVDPAGGGQILLTPVMESPQHP